jgi:hypothetical protein
MYREGLAATAVVALGTGIYVAAPYEQGQVYPLPEAEVYQRLIDMPLPDDLQRIVREGPGVDLDVEARPGEGVTHKLKQNGTMVLQMTSKITAESATSTRVKVEFQIGDIVALERDRPGSAAREIKALEDDPVIQGVVRITLQEQVTSTLEGRAYDRGKVQREVEVFIAKNPLAVAALKSKISSAAYEARVARMAEPREYWDETYQRDLRSRHGWVDRSVSPGEPMMSGRPMIDTRRYEDYRYR